MTGNPDRTSLTRTDWLLAATLAVTAVVYLGSLPLSVLKPPDGAHVLHQAVRLLDGEVLYRDLFDLVTPLWTYLMAALFALFGATLATARLSIAVVHGATMLVMFVLCRRLGVRREIAVIAAATQLIVTEPVYAVVNRHWLVTLVCLLLLLWCVVAPRNWRAALFSGVLVGFLVATHQQRGVTMGAGVAVLMLAQSLLDRRYGRDRAAPLPVSIAVFAGAVLAVVVPILGFVVWKAGFEPVWYALVTHPLTHYYGTLQTRWAAAGPRMAATTYAVLLKYIPVVLLPLAARFLVLVWQRRHYEEVRHLAALLIFCAFAILSIFYYPGIGHVAFIAPIFFVAFAEVAEWGLRALPVRWGVIAARLALLLVVASGASQLAAQWRSQHARFFVSRMTAFGRIDCPPWAAQRFDALEKLLAQRTSRDIYVHPISSFYYLILGARNPTRFEFFQPGSYNSEEQVREVLDALRPENDVLVIFALRLRRRDPIVSYVEKNYEPVEGLNSVWRPKGAATKD